MSELEQFWKPEEICTGNNDPLTEEQIALFERTLEIQRLMDESVPKEMAWIDDLIENGSFPLQKVKEGFKPGELFTVMAGVGVGHSMMGKSNISMHVARQRMNEDIDWSKLRYKEHRRNKTLIATMPKARSGLSLNDHVHCGMSPEHFNEMYQGVYKHDADDIIAKKAARHTPDVDLDAIAKQAAIDAIGDWLTVMTNTQPIPGDAFPTFGNPGVGGPESPPESKSTNINDMSIDSIL